MEVCLASSVQVRGSGEWGWALAHPRSQGKMGQGWVLTSPIVLASHASDFEGFLGQSGRRYSVEAQEQCLTAKMWLAGAEV